MVTFLDELAAVRDQVLAETEKTLDVPGAGGRIAVRFIPPQSPEAREHLTGIVAVYRVGGALSADQERQLLIDCCDEIGRPNPDTDKLDPFDADDGLGPLRFDAGDPRWGEGVKTARDCVSKLYNLDQQPLAVSGMADALIDWLQGIDAEVGARVKAAGKANGSGPG